jgi:hypothetical protein
MRPGIPVRIKCAFELAQDRSWEFLSISPLPVPLIKATSCSHAIAITLRAARPIPHGRNYLGNC